MVPAITPPQSSSSRDPIKPGLMVLHGNRLEDLRDLLTAWLARTPLQPLEDELMLVQSNGIAQWLKMALARAPADGGLGISAAIDVQLPGRFLWNAYRAVLDSDAVARTSPFDKSRLTWRLLRLIPQHVHEKGFAPLRDFLQRGDSHNTAGTDWPRHYQLAMQIADLFDQYQVYRADWLDDWERGSDVLRDELRGKVTAIDANQCWQPQLWRALLRDIGTAEHTRHRAAIHRAFMTRIAQLSDRPASLPRRLVVFGISSLPQQTLEALTAMARFSQVLLVVANPCRHYWADIIEDRELLRAEHRRQQAKPGLPSQPRYEDLHLHANPLLAAWGKQGRDYIRLLDSLDQPEHYREQFEVIGRSIDVFQDSEGNDLLQQVQRAILDLRPLPALPQQRQPWHNGDTSLTFHIAHSAQREVEILHDHLLDLFEQANHHGKPLAPRDVIVMVPDIQAYAPHVQAVFGRLPTTDPRHLPYSVADQSTRHSTPLIKALTQLLALPESRFAASDILDLLDVPALRRRFELAEHDLPTLRRWIEGAGIRWGLDGAQKQALQLPALEQNSWRFGLRRMLLGYAVGNGQTLDGVVPYPEIGGLQASLLGPLNTLIDRLEDTWKLFATPATPSTWVQRLRDLLEQFFDDSEADDALRLSRLHDALDSWQEACEEAAFDEEVPLNVVREHWLQAIDESRLSQRFMGGAVSFGTLMPMRAIPFRVVCLLGMNDGDYPRQQTTHDFDLMTRPGHARPGDRSRREDDRYLFLEALLSARDALHVSWVGRSARDNSELPPSVLVGQLRDYLAAGWHDSRDDASTPEAGQPLLDALTTEYPLQPFSRCYFEAGHDPRVFTYATEWQQAHRNDSTTQHITPLDPWLPDTTLSVHQLQRFLANPVRFFFNQRLKVHFTADPDDSLVDEPFALNPLQKHDAVRQVLHAALAAEPGAAQEQAVTAAVHRLADGGVLPPAGFGRALQEVISTPVRELANRWQQACARWPLRDAALELHHACGNMELDDWLTDLRADRAGQLRRLELVNGALTTASGTLRMDKLTGAWVKHLLANANGLAMQSQLIAVDAQPVFAVLSREQANKLLDGLFDALRQGMCSPLPVARKTAYAWLDAEEAQKDATKAATQCYEGNDFSPVSGERDQDACLLRAWPSFRVMHEAGFETWLSLYAPLSAALMPAENAA